MVVIQIQIKCSTKYFKNHRDQKEEQIKLLTAHTCSTTKRQIMLQASIYKWMGQYKHTRPATITTEFSLERSIRGNYKQEEDPGSDGT